MNYVQIAGDRVVNVVEVSDEKTAQALGLWRHPQAQIGWLLKGDKLEAPPPETQKQWETLRAERNRRLREHVDVINAVRWADMHTAERKAWQQYRKSLLDMPQNTEDPARPEWPERPPAPFPKPKTTTRKRARTKLGTYKGDDPLTPDVNEAWVES